MRQYQEQGAIPGDGNQRKQNPGCTRALDHFPPSAAEVHQSEKVTRQNVRDLCLT